MRFFLLALISLPVFACPNLTGTYTVCRSSSGELSGSRDVTVKQEVLNRVTVYTITATDEDSGETTVQKLIADGRAKTEIFEDEDTGLSVKTVTTATCSGSILKLKFLTYMMNEEVGNIAMNVTKAGGRMSQVVTGTAMGERIADTIVCE